MAEEFPPDDWTVCTLEMLEFKMSKKEETKSMSPFLRALGDITHKQDVRVGSAVLNFCNYKLVVRGIHILDAYVILGKLKLRFGEALIGVHFTTDPTLTNIQGFVNGGCLKAFKKIPRAPEVEEYLIKQIAKNVRDEYSTDSAKEAGVGDALYGEDGRVSGVVLWALTGWPQP